METLYVLAFRSQHTTMTICVKGASTTDAPYFSDVISHLNDLRGAAWHLIQFLHQDDNPIHVGTADVPVDVGGPFWRASGFRRLGVYANIRTAHAPDLRLHPISPSSIRQSLILTHWMNDDTPVFFVYFYPLVSASLTINFMNLT